MEDLRNELKEGARFSIGVVRDESDDVAPIGPPARVGAHQLCGLHFCGECVHGTQYRVSGLGRSVILAHMIGVGSPRSARCAWWVSITASLTRFGDAATWSTLLMRRFSKRSRAGVGSHVGAKRAALTRRADADRRGRVMIVRGEVGWMFIDRRALVAALVVGACRFGSRIGSGPLRHRLRPMSRGWVRRR